LCLFDGREDLDPRPGSATMTSPQIVQTVTGQTMAEVRQARDRAAGDLVELRLDGVADIDVAAALDGRTKPVIVTCRARWEGGRFDGPEDVRLGLLAEAFRRGAEFVDVEFMADRRRFTADDRRRMVVSSHDFDGMPTDLSARVQAMRAEGCAVVKLAVTPAALADCLTLRDAMRMEERHVAIAMGARGQLTRLCPWLFGSCWTYGGTIAPGQVAAAELRDLFRVHRGSARTAIYAIGGAPLAHSASPAMHNAAFAALGMDAIYVPLETADGDEFLAVAGAIDLAGASITAPLKPAMFERAATHDELSTRTGSVNTLRRAATGWDGRNFDVAGFLSPFVREGRSLRGLRATVLGAGGSARTACVALAQEGARVAVSARDPERGRALAHELGVEVAPFPPPPGSDLLVNTTPVGTWPRVDDAPVGRASLAAGVVYDLIYNPRETTLLRWARDAGADTIDGLEMLVGQACLQFEWWTGREAPRAVMAAAADEFIRSRQSRAS
jgi:3-dehydroquinate dehydratase/shikimate dehydrogenase